MAGTLTLAAFDLLTLQGLLHPRNQGTRNNLKTVSPYFFSKPSERIIISSAHSKCITMISLVLNQQEKAKI